MTECRPLHLSTPIAAHVFGGRAIVDRLGRDDLPAGRVADTWEVSDVTGMASRVEAGPGPAGCSTTSSRSTRRS